MVEDLFGALPTATLLLDTAGCITLFNRAAEGMFACAASDVIGHSLDFLLPETLGDTRWVSPLPQLLLGRDGRDFRTEHLALFAQRLDGTVFPVEASIASAAGLLAPGFIVVLRNPATSPRSDCWLRESEECFRIAFESETVAFAITELSGQLRAVNSSLCNLLGYSRDELLSNSFQSITFAEDLPADLALAGRLVAGEIDRYRLEKRYVHKQGHVVWALLSVSLVRDGWGAPLYFVAHATDITSLKNAQQALAQHAEELERSNAELEHFASVASHDLQAPLRTVTSYTQLLAERYRAQVDDRADRWIGYIVGGVDKMRSMIDGLLSLARVRMDRERLLPADTAAIVDAEWERLGASTDTGGAQLSHGFLPVIVADAAQMEQLFQNLLSNAVKYRRADLPLRITVSATRQVGSARAEWEFAVTDNGVGVDMIHAKRIFEIFERVPGDIDQTGAGIGLAVCERIVARHGGRIWVESELGSGARFRFTLVEQTT